MTGVQTCALPICFNFAASPHLAAKLEKKRISEQKIKQSFKFLAALFDQVIVEGIGGALVPFNNKKLVIDIAVDLALPVLIVAQNKLGAINHTLLTIEALQKRKMKILGVVFNSQPDKESQIILDDNPQIIKALTKVRIFGSLPWLKDKDKLYTEFRPLGNKILTQLKRK